MSGLIVLHTRLPADGGAERVERWLQRLPYARRIELERREPAQRLASVCGLELALAGAAILGATDATAARLRFPDGGKPHFDGGPPFSISHTAARVAVALSADREIGLDIEETGAVPQYDAGRRRLQRWTATEATLKALGAGLRRAMDVQLSPGLDTARLDGTEVFLHALELVPGTIGHLATLQPTVGVAAAEIRL